MTILHLSFIFSSGKMQGVKKKLGEMAGSCHPNAITFHVFNPEIESDRNGLVYHNVRRLFGFLTPLVFRAFRYIPAIRLLNAKPDGAVVLRYAGADLSLLWLCRKHGSRVYFEHHTKETKEVELSSWPFFMKQWQLLNEHFLGAAALKYSAGLIAVTQDILDYECERLNAQPHQLKYVCSNGLTQDKQPEPAELNTASDCLNLVFIAAQFHPWHGCDRLVTLIERYTGSIPISISVIGKLEEHDANTLERAAAGNDQIEIRLMGLLPTDQVMRELADAHVAIDSLAMDRLHMSMSSTLKSKQYIQAGVPVIGSAIDQDIGDDERIFFAVPTDLKQLDLGAVVSWRLQLDPVAFTEAVASLAPRLSWSSKLQDLAETITAHQSR